MQPDMSRLLSMVLPDDTTLGEPYWAIMATHDGQLTGQFWTVYQAGHTVIPLFEDRDSAESVRAVLSQEGMVVRGIAWKHLQFLRRRPPQGAELGVVQGFRAHGELTIALLPPSS
ncbi:MAG: hypothetical protein C7B44_07550 [Sulfobacillus thermosulfidooxidans]|uniref:hypothetical protein n=1 Tax=Sulfobacillus TaxID=28033 RepID=UPI000CD2900F|nr:hypothetical protein [Sulfobacillus sp. hq2]MCY0908810.1 hypothetical protein [Sulfobacillus thermotolerans]POB09898.1 hypothetical protein CO251_13465 [Sulfobacillus sp. hq2]PSR36728.1 MAG: hypothetical protein C7B44_07550 [Sulfobacillus thermosulfidooxidans]